MIWHEARWSKPVQTSQLKVTGEFRLLSTANKLTTRVNHDHSAKNGPEVVSRMEKSFSVLRREAGLTVKAVAEELEISVSTAYRYDSGESKPRASELRVLQTLASVAGRRHGQTRPNENDWFTFIDLFAGIGGLRRGFESIGGRCVFTSEWDKYAVETYRANYKCDHALHGDITKVDEADIPEHDVLLAGFPCQPFSIAGVSKKNALNRPHGFACETQGTLFFEVERIIKYHRPAAFLLENVKNLVSHDKGNTFRVIRDVLENKLGYRIEYRVIDARHFVPQHRERIIIVGFRDGATAALLDMKLPALETSPRLGAILHREDGSESSDPQYIERNIGSVFPKYTLTDHLWTYLQNYAAKHKAAGNGFGFGLVGPDDVARTLSARYYKDGSEILVKKDVGAPRRLTPRECARLMGFDRANGSDFRIPVSDTQAYRQFGNSVAVPVIEAVAQHIAPALRSALAQQRKAA